VTGWPFCRKCDICATGWWTRRTAPRSCWSETWKWILGNCMRWSVGSTWGRRSVSTARLSAIKSSSAKGIFWSRKRQDLLGQPTMHRFWDILIRLCTPRLGNKRLHPLRGCFCDLCVMWGTLALSFWKTFFKQITSSTSPFLQTNTINSSVCLRITQKTVTILQHTMYSSNFSVVRKKVLPVVNLSVLFRTKWVHNFTCLKCAFYRLSLYENL